MGHIRVKYINIKIMEYIKKENGNVWLVKEWDVYGKHKTISYLGKEFIEVEDKPTKKTKQKKDEE